MASAGDSGGRKSVGFQEVGEDDSPASEEGVPPETAAQPQPQLEGMSRTKSMKSRNHFLVHAGLEQMVAEGGHRTEQLRQEKVFRSCPATGIWSLHFPLPKPGSGKPRGYATRTLDTRTHERPERATPGTFDPFDLDNTHLTPPPTLVVPDPVDPAIPMIRVFANKFPVLTAPSEDDDGGIEGAIEVAFVDKLFPQVSAVGLHEVVVQHWKLNVCQALMTPQEVQLLWGALHERFKHLQTTSHARYVQLMENHGPRSGGSLPHAHSQLLGLPIVPGEQAQRYSVAHSYFEENEQSVFHAMIQKTLGHVGGDSDRTVLVSDGAVAMCPNAQERSHEIWILPYSKDGTAHRCSFGRATPEELGAVAVSQAATPTNGALRWRHLCHSFRYLLYCTAAFFHLHRALCVYGSSGSSASSLDHAVRSTGRP